jgi:hypothetical protein
MMVERGPVMQSRPGSCAAARLPYAQEMLEAFSERLRPA